MDVPIDKHLYSVPIDGTEEEGYTAIRRCPKYADRLLSANDLYDGKIKTGWDIFQRGLSLKPESPCFGYRIRNQNNTYGDFTYMSYNEVESLVLKIGSGFLNLNVMEDLQIDTPNGPVKTKMVGIYSPNSVEWLVTEQVCNGFGLTLVPLYDTLGEESIVYILNTSSM